VIEELKVKSQRLEGETKRREREAFRTFEDLEVYKKARGYIRFVRNRKSGASLIIRESSADDELSDEFNYPF
jgi:hypothetical protein